MYGICPYIINSSNPTSSLHRAFSLCVPHTNGLAGPEDSDSAFWRSSQRMSFTGNSICWCSLFPMWSLGHWINADPGKRRNSQLLEAIGTDFLQDTSVASATSISFPKRGSRDLLVKWRPSFWRIMRQEIKGLWMLITPHPLPHSTVLSDSTVYASWNHGMVWARSDL